jgi:hypothetical protein
MADVVAIISVASSAAVALGTTGITAATTARRERERLTSETRRDRENELRGVADDAAMKLSNAIYHVDRGREQPHDLGPLHEAFGQIWNCEDRLAIRLGDDTDEVSAYASAVQHVGVALGLLAASGGRGLNDQEAAAFESARETAQQAQRRFRQATSRRLSPDPR